MNDFEGAISDFSKAIEFDHTRLAFYLNRALSYTKLNQYREAVKDYTKVVEIDRNLADAYLYRSRAYEKLGEYDLALKDRDVYATVVEDPKYKATDDLQGKPVLLRYFNSQLYPTKKWP